MFKFNRWSDERSRAPKTYSKKMKAYCKLGENPRETNHRSHRVQNMFVVSAEVHHKPSKCSRTIFFTRDNQMLRRTEIREVRTRINSGVWGAWKQYSRTFILLAYLLPGLARFGPINQRHSLHLRLQQDESPERRKKKMTCNAHWYDTDTEALSIAKLYNSTIG